MRYIPLLLALFAGAAQATPVMEVSVVQGASEPEKYRFDLNGKRHEIDLRESHRYAAAFHDKASKKDICRDGQYHTGLLLTLRDVPDESSDARAIEVIGQVSTLKKSIPGETYSCGQNTIIDIGNSAFSDTARVRPNRTKVMVIDNNWTVFVTVKE